LIFRSPEVFSLRVRAKVPLGAAELPRRAVEARQPHEDARLQSRDVYWPEEHEWVETATLDGRHLHGGDVAAGPCLIELPHTTVAVAPGQSMSVDGAGSIVVSLQGQENT
jgi:N-methylhydantoinase A/oxoprolinase/acetone carboxylase beta subunit